MKCMRGRGFRIVKNRKDTAMADRVVENQDNEVPEIPEILEKVLLFSLDEAKQKLSQSNEVVPFTALAVK